MIQPENYEILMRFLKSRLSLDEMQEVNSILRNSASPEVFLSLHTIGRKLDAHFSKNITHQYDCQHMDMYIHEWHITVQDAKPELAIAQRAFRRIMVEGERDYQDGGK